MKTLAFFPFVIFLFISCNGKDDTPETGKLNLQFSYSVDDKILQYDTLLYFNQAGNHYLVDNIQYFISHVELTRDNGEKVSIQNPHIHYIDTDIPATQTWILPGDLPTGNYTSINFVIGLLPADNVSFAFRNPPESMMFWPEALGGGYHALKLNGKWLQNGNLSNFNIHIGRGKTGSNFVDNYCRIQLSRNFSINASSPAILNLNMNINQWFENPNTYDFNVDGSSIMENQEAMHKICENGIHVFDH